MSKKRRNERKREKTNKQKQSCESYKENIRTKLITNTKKQKLKIQSRVWNFKKYNVKKKKKKKKERKTKTSKVAKNIKKIQVQN